ncbi:MAG: hypothetical protein JW806_02160 [Sedimentisphaerales bacterium]|nr:hypothetical protein [Sedimentisphaerales bacterium]
MAANEGKGIANIFPQKLELMTKDSWSSAPLSTNSAFDKLSRYDAVWCAQLIARHNPKAWAFIRRNEPDILMLHYISGCSVQIDGGFVCLDYNYINKHHPEWFLLADNKNADRGDYKYNNKRIRWNSEDKKHSYYNRFYLDVANKEFQTWAAQEILNLVKGSGQVGTGAYDGVAMDNVYVGRRLHKRFQFKYPNWKYADDYAGWSKGYSDYLKTVKQVLNKHGFILVANHNPAGEDRAGEDQTWGTFYDSVDGLLSEQSLKSGWNKDSYFTGDKWLAAIERHEEVLKKGLINWWACHPEGEHQRDEDIFMYTYCSWLLIREPGKSLYSMHATKFPSRNGSWCDEYDLPIGLPVSKRYLQNNCWLREYNNGIIIVNPTKGKQKIIMDPQRLWLDWSSKKSVGEIDMPPRSGRILLPTPYKPE